MYLLFTDETNKEPNDNIRFFIYGGLFVPADNAVTLHKEIERIRNCTGYKSTDTLKFDTNSRPKHVSQKQATTAKKEIIEQCYLAGCKFSALVIHHNIAKKDDPEKKLMWSADHIIGHFNYFLSSEVDDYGICFADSLPVSAPNQYLADTFSKGLSLDGKQRRVKLDRIIALSETCINASHLASAIDIVLGTFRFCVNSKDQTDMLRNMARSVLRMMWCDEKNGIRYLSERGLILRPKNIKVPAYEAQYQELVGYLDGLIKN